MTSTVALMHIPQRRGQAASLRFAQSGPMPPPGRPCLTFDTSASANRNQDMVSASQHNDRIPGGKPVRHGTNPGPYPHIGLPDLEKEKPPRAFQAPPVP